MSESNSESNQNPIPAKPKRKYTRHQPIQPPTQSIAPNLAIVEMESAMPALMNQRMMANQKVREIQKAANRVNLDLEAAREELAQIENEVNYRLQTIAQMKGVPFMPPPSQIQPMQFIPKDYGIQRHFADYPQQQPPSPMYAPSIPFPTMPGSMEGIGSYPAPNRGLHPDATERTESAESVRRAEIEGGYGSIR